MTAKAVIAYSTLQEMQNDEDVLNVHGCTHFTLIIKLKKFAPCFSEELHFE
jgi:glutamate racemase